MSLHAQLSLLRLVSPALPVGAFSYSRGLEPAVAAGWVSDEVSAGDWMLGLLEHSLGPLDGAVLCRELPERAGVVGVPVSAFVHPDRQDAYRSLVRFAFCKRHPVLEDASARLAGLATG